MLTPGTEDEHQWRAALDTLGPASLSSLQRAVRRAVRGAPVFFAEVQFVDKPAADHEKDPDRYWPEPVELHFEEDGFTIFAYDFVHPEEVPDIQGLSDLIEPFLTGQGARGTVDVDEDLDDYGGDYRLQIEITVPARGRTARDAYELGRGSLDLIAAADGGAISALTALPLLRAGRVAVFIGQPETSWLDFKRTGYTADDLGRLELAKDVAAFANADGGLLVLGVASNSRDDEDIASAIMPCPPGTVSRARCRSVIRTRIHPPPEGVEILSIPQSAGGAVWVISIPPQADEFKPFLVAGEYVGGKVNGAYISIVTRRDTDNIPTNPQVVHALLAAGRAALRAP